MRTRYVWRDGEMIEISVAHPGAEAKIQVMPDIGGYKSMADVSWISSRSQHREHLRRHNCFEVGNEMPAPRKPVVTSREQRIKRLREQLWNMTDKDANKILAELRSQNRR
jgi:hypothetical protein